MEKMSAIDAIVGETAKAHSAFVDYVMMGSGRSLPKLARVYVRKTSEFRNMSEEEFDSLIKSKKKSKARNLFLSKKRQFELWSSKYNWQERVVLYNKEFADSVSAKKQEDRIAVYNTEMSIAEEIDSNCDLLRDRFLILAKFPVIRKKTSGEDGETIVEPVPTSDLVRMNKEIAQSRQYAMDIRRRAMELPTSYTQSNVTVHDGDIDKEIEKELDRLRGE